jgi:hypothetical protein
MYLGDGPTNTSLSNRSGAATAASTPTIADTEWPTKITSCRSRARQIARTSSA